MSSDVGHFMSYDGGHSLSIDKGHYLSFDGRGALYVYLLIRGTVCLLMGAQYIF